MSKGVFPNHFSELLIEIISAGYSIEIRPGKRDHYRLTVQEAKSGTVRGCQGESPLRHIDAVDLTVMLSLAWNALRDGGEAPKPRGKRNKRN